MSANFLTDCGFIIEQTENCKKVVSPKKMTTMISKVVRVRPMTRLTIQGKSMVIPNRHLADHFLFTGKFLDQKSQMAMRLVRNQKKKRKREN